MRSGSRRRAKTASLGRESPDLQRRKPRQTRAHATLETILEAAAQILEHEGPDALTIASLSDRSGYAIGTVYQYLPSKEAIFHELRRREAAKIEREIDAALASRGSVAVEETVRRIVHAVVDGFSSRQTMRRHVIAQTISDKGVAALFEPLATIELADRSPKGFVSRHLIIGPLMAALYTRPELLNDPDFRRELERLTLSYAVTRPA
jgi:AcrR family transcriptional regulator